MRAIGTANHLRAAAGMAGAMQHLFQSNYRWKFVVRLVTHLTPIAVALVALQVRLHGLGSKPFWLDEVASLHRATTRLPDLVVGSLHSQHYPTYFLLLWLVAKFGASEWLLRLPSAVFGAVSVGLSCAIGRDVDRLRTGVAAGLLLAFSPFDVQYGQEARSYTLVACLILVALWGVVRLAREPAIAAFRFSRESLLPPLPWFAYSVGTAAALNVLNVALPWLVAANLGALAIARRSSDTTRATFLRNWGVAQAIVIATWVPSAVAVYTFSNGSVIRGPGWAPTESVATIWSVVAPVYLHRISAFITFDLIPVAVPGLSLVIASMACYGAWRLRSNSTMLAVIGCAAFVLPMLLLLVSFVTPVLVPRYFAWSAAPFFILAGAGLGRLRKWAFAACMGAIAAACLINLKPYYKYEAKPRWDLAAAMLATKAQQGDVVLVNGWYPYYVLSAFAAREELSDRRLILTWEPTAAADAIQGHALWVLHGRAGQGTLGSPEDYLQSLSWLGQPTAEMHIGQYIVLWRFNEAPGAQKQG